MRNMMSEDNLDLLSMMQPVTGRVVSLGAEKWLRKTQKVLNLGEIELVDYMGTEEQVVGIARISHGKIFPHTDSIAAQKLINYLMEHRHTSPFEFAELTWRWRLPILVARQVVRHRTAGINEYSGRYAELSADLYIPEASRILGQDTKNKQGSAGELSFEAKQAFIEGLEEIEKLSKEFYRKSLESGISKELARTHLPVGIYTDWVWKMDLHNLFHFLGLRLDHHAQYEVRVYAEAMWTILKDAFPMCCQAFEEYRLYSKTLSRSDLDGLKAMLAVYLMDHPERRDDPNLKRVLTKVGL